MPMTLKFLLTLAIAFSILTASCGCSDQARASGTMERVEEDGTLTVVEPNEKVEGQLSMEELIAKQDEISSALKELSYIDDAAVILSYLPGDSETLCFTITLIGENPKEYADSIIDTISAKLDSCDLEHSSIIDATGEIIYPIK